MVRLPSGELRNVRLNCKATIGQLSATSDHANVQLGKAGRTRHHGHPPDRPRFCHEPVRPPARRRRGQEPRSVVPAPVTPWGKPAMGYKTRKKKNRTDKLIVKRRNAQVRKELA